MNFILKSNKYSGNIKINEPEKCERLEWFSYENIPDNVTSKVKNTLKEIKSGIFYDNINFKKIK